MSQALPRDLKLKFSHPFFHRTKLKTHQIILSHIWIFYIFCINPASSDLVIALFICSTDPDIYPLVHNLEDFLDIERGLLVMG